MCTWSDIELFVGHPRFGKISDGFLSREEKVRAHDSDTVSKFSVACRPWRMEGLSAAPFAENDDRVKEIIGIYRSLPPIPKSILLWGRPYVCRFFAPDRNEPFTRRGRAETRWATAFRRKCGRRWMPLVPSPARSDRRATNIPNPARERRTKRRSFSGSIRLNDFAIYCARSDVSRKWRGAAKGRTSAARVGGGAGRQPFVIRRGGGAWMLSGPVV